MTRPFELATLAYQIFALASTRFNRWVRKAPGGEIERGRFLHLKADRTHECQGISAPRHTRTHLVIESHGAVFELVCEVNVGGPGRQRVSDLREGQVMSGHQPDRAVSEQRADYRLRPKAALIGVRALQELVKGWGWISEQIRNSLRNAFGECLQVSNTSGGLVQAEVSFFVP